jgi:16S rRNA (guanine527-N7)-methyltransferase
MFHVEQTELLALLNTDLSSLDLHLAPGIDGQLLTFLEKVLVANETMNLTSITDKGEAVHKHLVDSLSVLMLKTLMSQVHQSTQWVDVGSGAGFPGMALALAVPSATVHLVESTGKKAHFLNTASAELGLLKRVKVHNQRAEVMAQYQASGSRAEKNVPRGTQSKPAAPIAETVPRGTAQNLRDSADAVFFRGVARIASLVELGAPFLKVGGLLVAYKGPKAAEELTEAAKAMKELKVELVERKDFILPGVLEARSLVCFRKNAETTKKFPRLTGLAQKEPIV